ncbi:MAG: hypothetical protein OXH03_05200 [Bacteroidetes bacterium]|nr:hypothetical protein [Bacteroidota bacterium]MDE2671714.1 hypothetical protein [Bacteroidota bacterium]
MATQLGQIYNGFVDVVLVGWLGPAALAGVALGNATYYLFVVISRFQCVSVRVPILSGNDQGNDASLFGTNEAKAQTTGPLPSQYG